MIRIKRLESGIGIDAPHRGSVHSAGLDLRSAMPGTIVVWPGQFVVVGTGFAWEIPRGYVGLIRDRSGLAITKQITTRAGVIDSDYRGEVGVVMTNESEVRYTINRGERIAQMVIVECPILDLTEVIELDDTDRGEGGYGSTGMV